MSLGIDDIVDVRLGFVRFVSHLGDFRGKFVKLLGLLDYCLALNLLFAAHSGDAESVTEFLDEYGVSNQRY